MNPKQRKQLEDSFAALPKRERDRLFDEARKQRSDAQKRRRTKSRETADGERVGSKSRPDPLEDWVLRILADELKRGVNAGQHDPDDDQAPGGDAVSTQAAALVEGQVVGLTRRWAEVLPDVAAPGDTPANQSGNQPGNQSANQPGNQPANRPVGCRLSAELAARQQSGIAVGDRAVYTTATDGDPEIVRVLERRTVLSRPDPRDPTSERVVAANIDAVVIVVSVRSPPLHPRLIDRYLVAIEHGGAGPIIAVNKADLLGPADLATELRKLDPYRAAGIPVVVCRAQPETGEREIEPLRALLAGKACAFVGHSGVGKSSLANALAPGLALATGVVRSQDLRGRHTTTASTMHHAPGGIRVIDTPGVRFFGLADVTPDELRWMFPEFLPFAPSCHFTDCTHDHEPDCAVKAAVAAGQIAPVRHETYLRLLEELRTGKPPGEITERIRPPRDG